MLTLSVFLPLPFMVISTFSPAGASKHFSATYLPFKSKVLLIISFPFFFTMTFLM